MKIICKLVIQAYLALHLIVDIILTFCYKKQMTSCGHHVTFKPSTSNIKGIENMSFGNYVRIHKYATIFSSDAKLIIGNKVALGPKVTIMTGNHATDTIGTFMWDVHDKKDGLDKDVIIEDEIWVGSNVTILSGAHISRGCVIAAGAIVNKYIPPYSIVGGVPAKVLKYRFTPEQIIEHEKALYIPEKRLTLEQIIHSREIVKK
jgi:acetyltransferase-like isoleucine patch superfamily enzyme